MGYCIAPMIHEIRGGHEEWRAAELPAEFPVELSDIQTVNPKDVWKPTDLERFASPVAEILQPPVILQKAQTFMTSMGESSIHYETEINVFGSSLEATTESIFLSYSLL